MSKPEVKKPEGQCRIEMWSNVGYYTCLDTAVHDGVCEWHHRYGATKELFDANHDKQVRI